MEVIGAGRHLKPSDGVNIVARTGEYFVVWCASHFGRSMKYCSSTSNNQYFERLVTSLVKP